MSPYKLQLLIVVLVSLCAAVSEGLIKSLSRSHSITAGLFSREFLFLAGVALVEIASLLFLYKNGMEVSKLPVMAVAFTTLFCVIIGVSYFHETINIAEGSGIIVTLVGICLIVLGKANGH